ncbi:uncharacterized protein LOC114350349 [Ostrinia furnacalis]|uniref:uncharacterized protein LOC114350349 n=1 Tax=Ostrinia furnacalis TaxID=93504 RepID=UPI001038CCD4|nr:uncharacterized protein LOC114350349 [Ostrinia furnacalis]
MNLCVSGRTELVVHEISLNLALGQIGAVHTISFQGKGHRVKHVRVRAATWQVYNLHPTVCKIKHDDRGAGTIEINLGLMSKKSFGHYFAIVDSPEGVEEKIRIMQVHQADLKSTHVVTSFAVGEPAEATMTYDCPQCQLVNVLCNGADVLDNGHVVPEPPNTIKINYPSFEDSHSCVYKGVFKEGNQTYETLLAVIDNVTIPTFEKVDAPKENEPFEQAIKYQCAKTCNVEKVYANGIPLTSPTNAEELERNLVDPDQTSSPATFKVSSSAITIHIDKYSEEYDGQYQAVFSLDDGSTVTKDIMEVINLNNTRRSAADNGRKYLTDANPSADHHITEEPIEGISDSRHVASTVANVADILTTRREELTILPSTNTIPTATSGNPTTILSFPTTVIDTTTPITTNVSSKP